MKALRFIFSVIPLPTFFFSSQQVFEEVKKSFAFPGLDEDCWKEILVPTSQDYGEGAQRIFYTTKAYASGEWATQARCRRGWVGRFRRQQKSCSARSAARMQFEKTTLRFSQPLVADD
jgi:hypothetical protein